MAKKRCKLILYEYLFLLFEVLRNKKITFLLSQNDSMTEKSKKGYEKKMKTEGKEKEKEKKVRESFRYHYNFLS